MGNGLEKYRTMDTLGKSAPELVVQVYDGAISNLKEAIGLYKDDKYPEAHDKMEKAKKFVVHLYTTLDEENGGEIAKNLSKLYAFVIEQINFVEATKSLDVIQDSLVVLGNIRDGWAQLASDYKEKNKNQKNRQAVDKESKKMSFSV